MPIIPVLGRFWRQEDQEFKFSLDYIRPYFKENKAVIRIVGLLGRSRFCVIFETHCVEHSD